MSALRVYRDDGLLASALPESRSAGRLAWLGPPLARLVEYGALLALARLSDPGSMPFCFAFLAVLAFHHYDSAYRLRIQGAPPPSWVGSAGGGWELRIAVALVLALGGVLGGGLLAGAIALGTLWVGESAASWARFVRSGGSSAGFDEELE